MHTTPAPRSRLANLAAMTGICLVIMLIALDQTVVGTAMPSIIADLKGYALYPWTASAYLLTSAIMMLLAGRLGDLHGRKPFVLASVLLFTGASVLCGLAQTMPQLIAARVLQGVGGGTLSGVAFACITDLFPDRVQRVRWQAMLSAAFGISTAVGPTLGGFMTEHLGWRSVFYVNLPVACLAFPMVWRFLPPTQPQHPEQDRRIDWLGVVLFAAGLSLLLLGTEQGQDHGFLHLLPPLLMVAGFATLVFFVRHQVDAPAPLLPGRMLLNAGIIRLTTLSALAGASMFLIVFYTPLLLQGGLGLSPRQSGMMMTPMLVCITAGSLVNGRLLPRLHRPELLLAKAFLGMTLTTLVLAFLPTEHAGWPMIGAFVVCGFCLGFQLPNLTIQMQFAAEKRDIGVASALVQTSRVIGSLVGASAGAVVVNLLYARHVADTTGGLMARSAEASELLSSPQILIRAAEQQHLSKLGATVGFDAAPLLQSAREALNQSVHQAYLLCTVLCILGWWLGRGVPKLELRKGGPGQTTKGAQG
jgi:EmrB/QacA subfamily drug resistance transporter